MPPSGRRIRFRTPETIELLDVLLALDLVGVKLAPLAEGQVHRNMEPLAGALAKIRADPLDGPISKAIEALRPCTGKKLDESVDEGIWQTLVEENISIETVLELLSFLADTDNSPLAVAAATLYFSLLRVPGAFLYHVFNALVVRASTSALKKWIYTVADLKPKKKSRGAKASVASNATERASKASAMDEDDQDEEEEEAVKAQSSPQSQSQGKNSASIDRTPPDLIVECLHSIAQWVSGMPLNVKSDSYAAVLELAVEMSKITSIKAPSKQSSGASKSASQNTTLLSNSDEIVKAIWDEAYAILGGLTLDIHGGEAGGMAVVIKSLLPSVMMTGFPTVSTTIPKETQQIRKRTLAFMESLVQASSVVDEESSHMEIDTHLSKHGHEGETPEELEMTRQEKEEFMKRSRAQTRQQTHSAAGHNALQLLMQHICMEIPEKAEYRHAAHATVGDLISLLYTLPVAGKSSEHQHAPRFISFLLKYGRHKKPIFRLFATEVAEELLLHPTFINPVTLSTVVKKVTKKSKKAQQLKEVMQDLEMDENGEIKSGLNMDESAAGENAMDVTTAAKSKDGEEEDEEESSAKVAPTVVFSHADHLEMLCHLAQFLLERSSDKIVNVRSKALGAIASTLERVVALKESGPDQSPHLQRTIAKIYFGTAPIEGLSATTHSADFSAETQLKTPQKSGAASSSLQRSPSVFKTPEPKITTSDSAFSLVALVTKRLEDERSTVRKCAVQLLEMVCRYDRLVSTSNTLTMFKNACFDPLLIIRKQASVSITNLLVYFPTHPLLMATWVQSVPVLAFDAELSVQEACVKSFIELVLERLLRTHSKKNGLSFESDPQAWQLFEMTTSCGSDTTGKVIGKLCQLMTQSSDTLPLARKLATLLSVAVTSLLARPPKTPEMDEQSYMDLDERRSRWELACWKTLATLALHVPTHVDHTAVFRAWASTKDDTSVSMETKFRIVSTLSALVNELGAKEANEIARDLWTRLSSFKVAPSIVQASANLLIKLKDRENAGASGSKMAAQTANLNWMAELVTLAEAKLADIVIPSDKDEVAAAFTTFDALDAILFTVGEIAQILPKTRVPSRLVLLLQTFIANTFKGINVDSTTFAKYSSATEPTTTTSNSVHLLPIPPATRALAFVSLGKFCLQDQQLAKTCIAAFARELEVSPSSIVRNNIMVVICDLVVRYSNLVDNYLGKLAICLRDESEMVRRQTLLMLTNLLQEEFIKLKQGQIFFPLILSLVDESEVLRQFALLCIEGIMSKQGGASHIFFSNFVETIFFLNDYRLHPTYNQFHYSARDRQIFNMAGGGANRTKRFQIYKIFFDHMEEQHKYQVSFKLCEDIIQAILDGQLPLEEAQHILYDVLCILSSEEIRLKHIGARAANKELDPEQLEDDINNAKADNQKKIAEATGQLAAQVVKRTTIERIVPIMIDLKDMLARHHSPLLKNVMDYLSDLIKDMPDEMAEVLEHNRQLAMELAYETRLSRAIKASRQSAANNGNVKSSDAVLDELDGDAADPVNSEAVEARKGKKGARPKPTARVGLTLASAASAPTPWKRSAPEVAEFAVPKLRTGTTPYKPSPARSHVSDSAASSSASPDEDGSIAAANAAINAGAPRYHSTSTPRAQPATPQTPKSAKPKHGLSAPPITPGDISSPMVARMRHASIVVRTPSSSSKSRVVLDDGSVAPHDDEEDAQTTAATAERSHAKRPRYIDSDGENSPEGNAKGKRDEDPSSPMAKKPQPKRPKTGEAPVVEESPAVSRSLAATSSNAPDLSPAPSRPKRNR